MKTLRAANRGMRDKYFDKAALAQLDKDQGRTRLNAPQQQSLLYLTTGRWLIEEGFHGLDPFLRKIGAWRRVRIALPLVKNALNIIADHMCTGQLISQANNLENLTVTLSATPIATPGGDASMCLTTRSTRSADRLCTRATSVQRRGRKARPARCGGRSIACRR